MQTCGFGQETLGMFYLTCRKKQDQHVLLKIWYIQQVIGTIKQQQRDMYITNGPAASDACLSANPNGQTGGGDLTINTVMDVYMTDGSAQRSQMFLPSSDWCFFWGEGCTLPSVISLENMRRDRRSVWIHISFSQMIQMRRCEYPRFEFDGRKQKITSSTSLSLQWLYSWQVVIYACPQLLGGTGRSDPSALI